MFFKLRLQKGPDDKKNAEIYIAKNNQRLILDAAAEAWRSGVPWEEAHALATRAIGKAEKAAAAGGALRKAKPKPKAKARAA